LAPLRHENGPAHQQADHRRPADPARNGPRQALLGQDIAAIIGNTRLSELVARWPGAREDSLFAEMAVSNVPGWPRSPDRRRQLVRGMQRGLSIETTD
jgi:transposase